MDGLTVGHTLEELGREKSDTFMIFSSSIRSDNLSTHSRYRRESENTKVDVELDGRGASSIEKLSSSSNSWSINAHKLRCLEEIEYGLDVIDRLHAQTRIGSLDGIGEEKLRLQLESLSEDS